MNQSAVTSSETVRGPIVIGRHGRPALDRTKGPRLDWRSYVDWWAAYEVGGLAEGQAAPESLRNAVADAERYLTSSRRRAQETMALAAPGRDAIANPVFDEAPLPPPRFKRAKFLPKTWNVIARVVWLFGHKLDGESVTESRARAKEAAAVLHEASADGKVFLAAHGWFNRMMRKELRKLGWACTYNGGDNYWSWRRFEYRK
ncbi:MAG: histidine phosphatase family protein [Pseudomonadota bacterium]